MRNRTLRNRMKAAFLTAALIGSTLMGAIPAQAEPESGADGEQVPKVITTDGAKVELPIEQYLNISKAATAKWPTLEGTYTIKQIAGDSIEATDLTLHGNERGNITLTFPHAGVYEAELNISAEATDPYNENDKQAFTGQYYLRAYVKNDGQGGFITDITAARDKDDPNTKVSEIAFGICADNPSVEKKIEGNIPQDEQFEFHLKAGDEKMPMPARAAGGEKVVNAPAGHVEFGWMFFDKAGTYTYEISETAGTNPNIAYDTVKFTKTIVVEENNGRLEINSSKFNPDTTTATFTNKYLEPAEIIIEAPDKEKVYDGVTITDADMLKLVKVTMPDGYKESDYNFEYTFADGQTVRNVGTYTIITGVRITDKSTGAVVATYGTMVQKTGSTAEVLRNAAGEFVRVVTFSPMVTYAAPARDFKLTVIPGSYKITPKEVTVTAGSVTRALSDPDPAFTATVEGVLAGEENLISYSLARKTSTNAVGTYTGEIVASGNENQGNYHVTFVAGDLTITNNDNGGGGGSRGGGGNSGGRRPRATTPTTPGEVLGATRDAAEDAGRGVLGAVRNPQGQVLGAVRTGDSSAMVTWAVILMLAASGIVGWFNVYQRRKRNI